MDNLLREKLNKALNRDCDGNARWAYVRHCLSLLRDLKDGLCEASHSEASPGGDADILSVQQQQSVSSMIQLVVALGVVPSLLPGVGLPLAKRSKFYELVAEAENESPSILEVCQIKYLWVVFFKTII